MEEKSVSEHVYMMARFRDTPYQVTQDGRVWSDLSKKFLALHIEDGYVHVHLSKLSFQVHRMVAEVFIPNPDNLPLVNHKDGIKCRNIDSNLEWSTHGDNTQHAFDNGLCKPHGEKPVSRFSYDGETKLSSYSSISEASRVSGISRNHIFDVLAGSRKRAGGFVWRCVNEL